MQSQERTRELRAVLFSGRRPRQLWLAGVRQRSRAALSGVLTSVLFCPEDLLILKKGAAGRRRLMDGVICQLRPNYEAALAEYGRLLDQKSALLRERYDNPSLLQVLPEYDLRMAQTGALVISYRARYVKALAQEAARYHREFSGDSETLELTYRTVSTVTDPFAPPETLCAQLQEHQRSHARAELESAQCLSGPHKDDFEAVINGLPVAQFASPGADAHGRHLPQACRARPAAAGNGRNARAAARRRAVRAGCRAAGLCFEPAPRGAGLYHLL